MICVQHRSASGDPSNAWELHADAGTVVVSVMLGAVPCEAEIPICSAERPRPDAHKILRTDEHSWRILPVRYVRTWPKGVETLQCISCPIAPQLGTGMALMLTAAPTLVSDAIERFITTA